jgi:hypothetical protein
MLIIVAALLPHLYFNFIVQLVAVNGKPNVKLYIYQLSAHLDIPAISHSHYGDALTIGRRDSEYHEIDPLKADYFWIPSGGHIHNTSALLTLLAYIKKETPGGIRQPQQERLDTFRPPHSVEGRERVSEDFWLN